MTSEVRVPTVSVVIPFHNRVAWLGEAVQSVIDQTYEDFEIVVIDDGSDKLMVSDLDFRDRRIRYVRQDQKGRSAARNRGIAISQGLFIAFLDSDDLFLPSKLERQVALMQAHPNCLLSHTSYERISAEGTHIGMVGSGEFAGNVYPAIVRHCPIATPTVMVRREAFDQGARFEESLEVGEDIVLWAHISRRSLVVGINEPLTKVRIHGTNAASDPQSQIVGQANLIQCVIRKDRSLSWARRRELESTAYINMAYGYFRLMKPGRLMRFLIRAIITWPVNRRFFEVLDYAVRWVVRGEPRDDWGRRP